MSSVEIPLFPLQTVLFPGASIPLVIFEDRYKQMCAELVESGDGFGVVLIKEGSEVGGGAIPHRVGTIARITEYEPVDRGRFRLEGRGTRRFELLRMLPPRPYPCGEVRIIDDSAVEPDPRITAAVETVRATFPLYFKMSLMLTDQWARGVTLPTSPHRLVNYLAPWLQADEDAKQRLLEIIPPADRVGYLAELLDDLIARTRADVEEHRRRKWASLGVMS